MQRFVRIVLLICCFVFSKSNFSQDIRSAWIDHKWLSGYTYSITLTLLTDDNVNPSNHCQATIYFGDGDSCVTYRENGTLSVSSSSCPTSYDGVIINTSLPIRKSTYSCVHSYSGPGNYTVYSFDKLRVAGIKNITNSGTRSVYIEDLLSINAFLGPNNSSMVPSYYYSYNFSFPLGNFVYHNPSITDPDSDSLSYSLINCTGITPFSYYIPNPAAIDIWSALSIHKDSIGLYAFAYFIKEWRKDSGNNWNLIGSKIMDIVIGNSFGVGIKESDKKEIISLYPNPTSNILNIKSDSKTNSEIEITNQLGQTVLKQKYSENVDVSKLKPGYYFIRIANSYSKFIKE